jgi:hypothetical protein
VAGIEAHLAEPTDTGFARGRQRHAKTDLLTELSDVSAAQTRGFSQWSIAEMLGGSGLPGCRGLVASPIVAETGHTRRNHSPAFSSLPIFDVSRSGLRALVHCA